jgi:xanthosine utilization system XapX-like protein
MGASRALELSLGKAIRRLGRGQTQHPALHFPHRRTTFREGVLIWRGVWMRKFFLLALGWVLLVGGILITPMPIPIPLIGIVPFLLGCAILSQNSKVFRRFLQSVRHRYEWFSKRIEQTGHRMPGMVKHMIRRTNPIAHVRLARLRAYRKR